MADIFQEVDEEVRREQLQKLWERYGNFVIAALRSHRRRVGGWRGYEWWQAKKAAESGAAFEPRCRSPQAGKHQGGREPPSPSSPPTAPRAIACWRDCAKPPSWRAPTEGRGGRLRRHRGRQECRSGHRGPGRRCAPASCWSTPRLIPKSATRLEPLTAADRTFRHSARELLALSAWKSGDMAAARQWTDMIMTDPQTPGGTRSRAEVLERAHRASERQGLSTMRRASRSRRWFGLGSAAGLVLAACRAARQGGQFDPTTLLANDMFDTKKPS